LRRLARKYLPADVAAAPKRGFEIPLQRWTTGDLHPMIADHCLDPNGIIASIMDRAAVSDFIDRRWTMDAERWAKCAWNLLMLSLWDRSCRTDPVDQKPMAAAH
jgi:asparagine synthase (glutamine-hydrolysing)